MPSQEECLLSRVAYSGSIEMSEKMLEVRMGRRWLLSRRELLVLHLLYEDRLDG